MLKASDGNAEWFCSGKAKHRLDIELYSSVPRYIYQKQSEWESQTSTRAHKFLRPVSIVARR